MVKRLKKILAKLPHSPGVYFFYGPKKELLYIGKATDLRSRVNSYFKNTPLAYTRPIETFIEQVSDIKWQTSDSTLEALIQESNLINQLQPKYNVSAKDDKTFLGIYITRENYPRVFPARVTNKKLPEGEFFGPYTSSQKVRQALKILRRIFPYCNERVKSGRPCLYYHIKLCPGACARVISVNDYQRIVKNLKLFLKGKKKELIRDTKRHMGQAAESQNFEQAARLKQQLEALEHIHDITLQLTDNELRIRQQPWRFRIEAFDISNIFGSWAVGSMVTFIDGQPAKELYRRFKVRTVKGIDDVGMMKEVIGRRLKHFDWPLPDLTIIDGGQTHYNAIKEILDHDKMTIDLLAIAKGKKRKKTDLYGDQIIVKKYQAMLPILIKARNEAHRFAIAYHRLLRAKDPFQKSLLRNFGQDFRRKTQSVRKRNRRYDDER